jgi:hypothetical protein
MFHLAGDAADDDAMQGDMPASNGHADDEYMQQGQQQQDEHVNKQDQDGQDGEKPKDTIRDLTKPSPRVRTSAAAGGECVRVKLLQLGSACG